MFGLLYTTFLNIGAIFELSVFSGMDMNNRKEAIKKGDFYYLDHKGCARSTATNHKLLFNTNGTVKDLRTGKIVYDRKVEERRKHRQKYANSDFIPEYPMNPHAGEKICGFRYMYKPTGRMYVQRMINNITFYIDIDDGCIFKMIGDKEPSEKIQHMIKKYNEAQDKKERPVSLLDYWDFYGLPSSDIVFRYNE